MDAETLAILTDTLDPQAAATVRAIRDAYTARPKGLVVVPLDNPLDKFTVLAAMEKLQASGYPASVLLLTLADLHRLISDAELSGWFDPTTKVAIVRTGYCGCVMGMTTLTDAYVDPEQDTRWITQSCILGGPMLLSR